jgi:predicted DNA-binding transcriptional regulator YafY
MPAKFLERFQRIDDLIYRKSTGTPQQLADRLELSESTLYEYLSVMRSLGAPIAYSRERQSYYYKSDGHFIIDFK